MPVDPLLALKLLTPGVSLFRGCFETMLDRYLQFRILSGHGIMIITVATDLGSIFSTAEVVQS